MIDIKSFLFKERHHGVVDRLRVGADSIAIDSEEHVGTRERNSLVAVDERVILDQALKERSGLVNDSVVVAGLGTVEGSFERSDVTNALRSAVTFDQLLMKEQSVCGRDVLGHLANDR